MYLPDGFLGQRVRVLPRPVVLAAQGHPIVRRFLVTDAGYFPHASEHGRTRGDGAKETIIIVCTAGAGSVEIADSPALAVKRGDALIIAPGVRHSYQADARNPWTIWWMHVVGEDAEDFSAALIENGGGSIVPLHDVYTVVQSLEEVVEALEKDETMPTLVLAAGAAWRALAHITASRMRGAAATSDRVSQVQDYLRNNLTTSFSVPELASMAGLSTSHFSALFRASAGTSVKDYLKRLRIARARELLITTELTVAGVAVSVGYDDALYFSRQFRGVNGMSPSAFRRQARSQRLMPA